VNGLLMVAEHLFLGLIVLLAVAAFVVVLRSERRSGSENTGRGLSPTELYVLRRRKKNAAMRQLRAVARENRTPASRQHSRRERQS
jgi:hypothetical protein